jgi:hypothetical protein
MKIRFNTGRMYGPDGQWITAEVIGEIVYFNDETRMIDGHFRCMERDLSQSRLIEKVMLAYGHSMYTYGKPQ